MRTLNFYISNPANGDSRTAHPIYADGFGFVTERESGQIFTRTKLSDGLTFTAEDFSFIMSQPFDSIINVNIDVVEGGINEMQWAGNFARTDCTINEVDGVLTVTPEVVDEYTDILNILDVEFNLAQLPIKQHTPWATVNVPPVLQIYFVGKQSITNYWQGECWQTDVDPITDTQTLEDMGFGTSWAFRSPYTEYAYVRVLCSTGGEGTVNDKYNINPIFKYYRHVPYEAYHIQLIGSHAESNTPTQWGAKTINGTPTGKYYALPTASGKVYVPFRGMEWDTYSLWLEIDETKTTEIDDDTQFEFLKTTYETADLLSGLLAANNLGVTFAADAQHSEFLYNYTAPITGWTAWQLLFTAKSNILSLIDNNTAPATQVPCTLATVLNFFKNAMKVYWTVENGNLRLEHLSYYKNGGTYSGTPSVQYDLTQIINPRNGKPWAFGQNQYRFEKYEIPQYVNYKFMDETDKMFDGSGLECLSNYVAKGRTEEVTVANVSTNIVKMFLQPEKFSMDGMAVVFVRVNRTDYTAFTRQDIGGNWRISNGELAMWTLQTSLLLYDAPCDKIKVSGGLFSGVDYKRTKYNEVVFPAQNVDPDKHIITNVGDGEPETITNDLTSNSVKVKLKYLN